MANTLASRASALTFTFSTKSLRAITIDGEPWFVASDVCDALDHTDTSKAVSRLDNDEKLIRTLFSSGQNREVLFINESGLYSLILTSRKAEAKKFKKWVTSEVLPAIRRTGRYIEPAREPEPVAPAQLGNLGTWVVRQVHNHTDRYLSRTSHGNAASLRRVVSAHFGCKASEIPSSRLPELLDVLEKFAADAYAMHYVCRHLEEQLIESWSKRPSAIPQAIKQLMVLHPAPTAGSEMQSIRARAGLLLLGVSA